jgi:hypothetical protein
MKPTLFFSLDRPGNEIRFLPQSKPAQQKGERFAADEKRFSLDTNGRNAALALLMEQTFAHIKKDTYLRVYVLESVHNTSSFYAFLAAAQLGVPCTVHTISSAVEWESETRLSDDYWMRSHWSVADALSCPWRAPDVVFLDTCNVFTSFINDIYPSLNCMSETGGIWGMSWVNAHFMPTAERLEAIADPYVARIVKCDMAHIPMYKTGSGVQGASVAWVMEYCHAAARLAGFTLERAYEDWAGNVHTILFRVIPIPLGRGKRLAPLRRVVQELTSPEQQPLTPAQALTAFWSHPARKPILRARGGALGKHFLTRVIRDGSGEEEEELVELERHVKRMKK